MDLKEIERETIPSRADGLSYVMIFSQEQKFPNSDFRVCFAVLLGQTETHYSLGNPYFCTEEVSPEDGVFKVLLSEMRSKKTREMDKSLVGSIAELGVD